MALIPLFVLAVALAVLPVLLLSIREDRRIRREGVPVGYLHAGNSVPARYAANRRAAA